MVRVSNADIMEQPLPGSRGNNNSRGSNGIAKDIPSRLHSNARYETKKDIENKSQFFQQYENSHKPKQDSVRQEPPKAHEDIQDDAFFGSLRDDGRDRTSGPGWNNDTSFSGFGAVEFSAEKRRKPGSAQKDKTKSGVGHPDGDGIGKSDVVQARSRLSLLKSKIQRSSFGNQPAPSTYDGVQYEPENALRSYSATNEREAAGSESVGLVGKGRRPARQRAADVDHDFPDDHHIADRAQPAAVRAPPRRPAYQEAEVAAERAPPAGRRGIAAAPPVAAEFDPNMQEHYSVGRRPRAVEEQSHHSRQAAAQRQPAPSSSAPSLAGAVPDAFDDGGGPQMECPDCGRKFNPIPYEKHIKICAKVFLQKRKVFDTVKMRVADNPEQLKLLQKAEKEEKLKAKREAQAAKKSNIDDRAVDGGDSAAAKWKKDSEAFRAAMKAARQYSKAVAAGDPLPPPVASAPDSSLIPCPHCGRRFNEKAAERHIPVCTSIRAKPTSLRRGAGGGGGTVGTGSIANNGNSHSRAPAAGSGAAISKAAPSREARGAPVHAPAGRPVSNGSAQSAPNRNQQRLSRNDAAPKPRR